MRSAARFQHAAGQGKHADTLRLFVPGKPVPMPRPRVARHSVYHSSKSEHAKSAVAVAWQKAGCPRLPGGCLQLHLAVIVARPSSHLLVDGSLSAVGRRSDRPVGDVDNYLKLPLDALNGLAWDDDSQIVEATVLKRWTTNPDEQGLRITAAPYVEAKR